MLEPILGLMGIGVAKSLLCGSVTLSIIRTCGYMAWRRTIGGYAEIR